MLDHQATRNPNKPLPADLLDSVAEEHLVQSEVNKLCPDIVGGAKTILFTPIGERHRFTGNCKQYHAGQLLEPMAGLAICQYEGEDSYYLFGCDAQWDSVTDTWHESIEDAIHQAEFEYEGTRQTWVKKEQQ